MRRIVTRLITGIVAVTFLPFGAPVFVPGVIRRVLLRPYAYAVIASRLYRLRRREARFLPGLEPELRAGLEHNFAYRSRADNRFRPDRCFQITKTHNIDMRRSRLLIIGPRNFSELLLAYLHGFSWRNITGVDLYSEFPKVHLGRVEDLPFPDGAFDVVVCSGVLAYVSKVEDAMRNIVRVVKPGGLVILQSDLPLYDNVPEYNLSGGMNLEERIALVADSVQRVTHREDIPHPAGTAIHQFAAFKVRGQPADASVGSCGASESRMQQRMGLLKVLSPLPERQTRASFDYPWKDMFADFSGFPRWGRWNKRAAKEM